MYLSNFRVLRACGNRLAPYVQLGYLRCGAPRAQMVPEWMRVRVGMAAAKLVLWVWLHIRMDLQTVKLVLWLRQ